MTNSRAKEKEIIPTKPDNAQYQIMRIMLLQKWEHVRVLNLSDLRNGNSGNFSIEYKELKKLVPSSTVKSRFDSRPSRKKKTREEVHCH